MHDPITDMRYLEVAGRCLIVIPCFSSSDPLNTCYRHHVKAVCLDNRDYAPLLTSIFLCMCRNYLLILNGIYNISHLITPTQPTPIYLEPYHSFSYFIHSLILFPIIFIIFHTLICTYHFNHSSYILSFSVYSLKHTRIRCVHCHWT